MMRAPARPCKALEVQACLRRLIYDTKTGGIELPRQREVFNRDEIVHLQCISTKRLDWGGVVNNQRLSELNSSPLTLAIATLNLECERIRWNAQAANPRSCHRQPSMPPFDGSGRYGSCRAVQ
jgi:hypothetical protein